MAAALTGAPASAETRLALAGEGFNEVLRDAAEISGVVIAGIQRHGDEGGTALAADFPAAWADATACVRVLTGDGLYEAANAYLLPADWAGGVAVLPFPTTYGDLLASAAPGTLAIRAGLGDCDGPPGASALAYWNAAPGSGPPTLLVNAFRADEVFAYAGDAPEATRCTPLTIGGLSAFDHACALPADLRGRVEVTLYRIVNGKPAPPAVTDVWLGAP